jgi:hypothetical protein
MLKQMEGIDEQSYSLKKGNRVLDDNLPLADQGIKAGTWLTMDYSTI